MVTQRAVGGGADQPRLISGGGSSASRTLASPSARGHKGARTFQDGEADVVAEEEQSGKRVDGARADVVPLAFMSMGNEEHEAARGLGRGRIRLSVAAPQVRARA